MGKVSCCGIDYFCSMALGNLYYCARIKIRAVQFLQKIQPGGPGWKVVLNQAKNENQEIEQKNMTWSVPSGIMAMLVGCAMIYALLIAVGYWIYGKTLWAFIFTAITIISGYILLKLWGKIKSNIL